MPTQKEYWSGEFIGCPNCPNTNDGDIIYKCKETFLGGIADDISAALGKEITYCGKVFCEECGTILHYCPSCEGLGSMIGKIKSASSDDDEPDSDDDSSGDYESDSDDDSSSSSSDYSSPAKYASSAPSSSHASGQNNLTAPADLLFGLFLALVMMLLFSPFMIYDKYYKKAAPIEQNKMDDGIGGVSGSSHGDNSINVDGSTGVEISQQTEQKPLRDSAIPIVPTDDSDSCEEDSSVDLILDLEEPHAIDGAIGVVEQITHTTTLTATGRRLPEMEILVRSDNGEIYSFSSPQNEDIKVGNRMCFAYPGNNQK